MQQNNFPLDFFPEEIQDIILEVCSVYQFNPDFLSGAILSTAASAIGNTFSLKVKEGWTERNSLFIAIVASPGINKSAPLSWALRPIESREKELYKVYKQIVKDFTDNPQNKDKQPPPLIKTIVSDATPEAIVQQLHKNERGILIYNDELSGFLNTFQRYNKGNDEQFYLSVWSGKPVIVDRKTSASVRIAEPVINIVGTIQPSVFEKCFVSKEDSGFFDRWLIINPKNAVKECWADEDLRPEVYNRYSQILDKLQDIQFKFNSFDEPESVNLAYSKESWKIVKEWQRGNTRLINKTDMDHIKGIRAKMEIYVHRFATISHLLIYGTSQSRSINHHISEESIRCAILLCDYFINNAIQARSGNQSDQLPDQWKQLYDSLPAEETTFNYAQFVEYSNFLEIPESSAKRWLKAQTGKLITKVKHGTYSKV